MVEVSARGPLDRHGRAVDIGALDALVRREVLAPFEHRNLNAEVARFAEEVPTSENLARRDLPPIETKLERGVSGRVAETGEDPHRRDAARTSLKWEPMKSNKAVVKMMQAATQEKTHRAAGRGDYRGAG